jgi:RNA polymerase sigma factor (sigma-70 family)
MHDPPFSLNTAPLKPTVASLTHLAASADSAIFNSRHWRQVGAPGGLALPPHFSFSDFQAFSFYLTMPAQFPPTSLNLITRLKATSDDPHWQVSWKRFLELYHEPIEVIARSCYRHHTGGQEPSSGFIEDAVANTVADFFARGQYRYDKTKGRLRSYLRLLINARVVDLLRKERPIDHKPLPDEAEWGALALPAETSTESKAFHLSLIATILEDLRNRIPQRQFEIFERVKLKYQSPAFVAEDLGMTRAMVDRNIYKAMTALRELASHAEYQEEFYE